MTTWDFPRNTKWEMTYYSIWINRSHPYCLEMLSLLSLRFIKQILFNICICVCRLYFHDLFSIPIYCHNLSTLQSTLFPLSSNGSLNMPTHTVKACVFAVTFQSIDPSQQFTWEHSNLEVNKPKNRYANVIAYDHTRVILAPIEGED